MTGQNAQAVEDDQMAAPAEETVITDDTTVPTITTNLIDNQVLKGTTPLQMTVVEENPHAYSIRVVNPDGTNEITGQIIELVESPTNGHELTLDWNTKTVPNGSYKVIFTATDTADNSQVVEVPILVDNEVLVAPVQPEIKPTLGPIPLQQVITPSRDVANRSAPPATVLHGALPATGRDVLADRIDRAVAANQDTEAAPQQTCALFFNTCWYVSLPISAVVMASGYAAYRYRNDLMQKAAVKFSQQFGSNRSSQPQPVDGDV